MKIRYSQEAKRDLEEIEIYISETLKNPSAARSIIGRIVKSISGLASFPLSGASVSTRMSSESDYRYLVCGDYISVYLVEGDVVKVGRILNCRQDFVALLFGD